MIDKFIDLRRFDENVEIKEAPYVEIEEDVEPKEVVREDDRDDELSFDDGGHDVSYIFYFIIRF